MSFANCIFASHQKQLLQEIADGGNIEAAHRELEQHFENVSWLIACEDVPEHKRQWSALLEHGRGQLQAILHYWETEPV